MIIDQLIEKIKEKNNPTAVGLDTTFEYLPEEVQRSCQNIDDVCNAIEKFNKDIIDAVYDIVPCVKVQVAYYEQYGYKGMKVFEETLKYAKSKGMITIADVKRNDIGSTSKAYSKAYLSGVEINDKRFIGFDSDFITINPYLGADGVEPFVEDCIKFNKGLFILVKTSNPSGEQIQNQIISNKTVYQEVAALVEKWGEKLLGEKEYSSIGAVVGATHKEEGDRIRKDHPKIFFLIPGYGAQGGSVKDIKDMFGEKRNGAIVNSSRGIICAYKTEEYRGLTYQEAARKASLKMKEDLLSIYEG